MSTKVYTAYKLRSDVTHNHQRFWKWVRDTRARGVKEVQAVLRVIYQDLMTGVDTASDRYKELCETYKDHSDDYKVRLTIAHDFMMKAFAQSESTSLRHPFDFNVCITIRECEGQLYLIPYADMQVRRTLDFLAEDKRLVDFAYWNNVDRPEGMSAQRWNARGKVWDKLNDTGWRDYLLVTISDFSSFCYVDPWIHMMQEHRSKKVDKPATAK